MGLPLFVAPVESDIPSKTASKGTAISPGRSGIRRLSRPASRESRNLARSASVRIYGATQPRLPRSNQDGLLPWVESPGPLDPSLAEPRSRPAYQEARDSWLSSNSPATILRNRQNFQQQVESIFAGDWRERGPATAAAPQREAESRDADERWWSAETRSSPRARRAQVVPPLPSRFDRSPDRPRPYRGSPPHSHRGSRNGGVSPLGSTPANSSRTSGPRYNARPLRSVRDRRPTTTRHSIGVDGLGDRDRSLNPEVWDTLLSTLTPDPQQPSAGSSFASVEASQSADATSGTPLSLPDMIGQPAEAQCDSGCEHSDASVEEEDEENVDVAGGRRRRGLLSDGRARTPPYNPEAPIDGPADGYGARMTGFRGAPQSPARESSSLSDVGRRDARLGNAGPAPRGMPLARLLNRAEGLGRRALGGEAEEEEEVGGDDLQQQGRGESAGPAHSTTLGGEEEWSGMQRIVSSLARREDIPDEWWAEVGLSRTLPQDDASNQ